MKGMESTGMEGVPMVMLQRELLRRAITRNEDAIEMAVENLVVMKIKQAARMGELNRLMGRIMKGEQR